VADWNLPTLRAEVHATSGPQRDPEREPELTLWGPGVRPDPLSLLSPVAEAPGVSELGKGGP